MVSASVLKMRRGRFIFLIVHMLLTFEWTFHQALGLVSTKLLPLGSLCGPNDQCAIDSYCGEARCRRTTCRQNYECAKGEQCRYGQVGESFRHACFAIRIERHLKGGRPIINEANFAEACDIDMPCMGTSICNPIYGICCSKLRTCPYPRQPVLESDTHRPIICQMRGNRQLECPPFSQCEKSTGFCCINRSPEDGSVEPPTPEPVLSMPRAGDRCEEGETCDGGALCECEHGVCRCMCQRTLGYTLDSVNRVCRRARRRLKERCKFDLDCQSAYSECTTGGCRCKEGFERDGKGGCRPTSYKCVNHAEPLKINDHVMSCVVLYEHDNNVTQTTRSLVSFDKVPLNMAPSRRYDRNCPARHYCVAVFDIPKQMGMFQGFCCPTPEPEKPVCPVGNPHSSSVAPHYGCDECPWNYYCHTDTISKTKQICCPRACLSPEDVYVNGSCYPIAYNGDACLVSEQCVAQMPKTAVTPSPIYHLSQFETQQLDCIQGVCRCPDGLLFIGNGCQKIQCTVGLKSAPSLDTQGNLLPCHNTFDCDQGQICDPEVRVCCKGTSHCPKKYFETGRECNLDKCNLNEICVRSRKSKKRVCCQLQT